MNKILLFLVLSIASLSIVGAVQVNENVIFQTTSTGTNYYITTAFNCTNITVYSTALNINGGNITTHSNINMSMENLMNTTHMEFSNNITITNLTIQNVFANFSLISGSVYGLYYQSNDTKYDQTVATNQIFITSIPKGSWYITLSHPIWSNTAATSPIKDGQTSTITVDVDDPQNTINQVVVKIDGTNHTMVNLPNSDTYRYYYTDTSTIKKHYITDFYAQDVNGNWNATSSDLYIDVASATGEGGLGGRLPSLPSLPDISIPDITVLDVEIIEVTEKIEGIVHNVTQPIVDKVATTFEDKTTGSKIFDIIFVSFLVFGAVYYFSRK